MKDTRFESLYPDNTMDLQISKAATYIKKGVSGQIIGLPGTGKSTLLKLLAYNSGIRQKHFADKEHVHFVYMDFSEMKNRSLADVLKFILISLIYSLEERGLATQSKEIHALLKQAISLSDEIVLFQALKKAIELLVRQEYSIVFLFDRFDQYIPAVPEHFFINLKVLRNLAKYKFSCLFSLPRPLDTLLDPLTFADFYEYVAGNTIFIPLSDPIGFSFRTAYLEKVTGEKIPSTTLTGLLTLTGGHNKLSLVSLETLLTEKKVPGLKEFLLERRPVRAALYELWEYLTPHEKVHLKDLSSKELAGDEDVAFLTKVGLISEKGETLIPLFSAYINSIKGNQSQKLEFKPETNEIYKGEENITVLLSPSEFRLLRFLIQNKGKVLEKNEIINAVWKDTKTQEGVTDQALDQIIYRIRKKIEPEPNNPKYILTIKGKGIQYTE